ncbi:hypothetical protein roselon_01827 [Roseibacterium elongatum DSM 19469]|uniref:Uncharacterized protein n=1 Tax=Roseicyclus elongatus DSM 19469 TaxID=1294273 RepID=W8RST4_9RHOB|nr:hypothetical protein [Roseibacterium elongatum]AHM04193.1 hypothetical protein roselon_01827 [Roseibacterium elongatum DSM 19469]
MARDVVMRSIEDGSAQRCVDLIRLGSGGWAFVECRRDPEDDHGWRRVTAPLGGFASEGEALVAARRAVAWLAQEDRA